MTTSPIPDKAGEGFNLVMELNHPAELPELMGKLGVQEVQDRVHAALASLDYVHYARFLPLWEQGVLLIITEFDGIVSDYVLDFAAVLDDEFSLILSYMKGQPRLPVSKYPAEFWAYVSQNIRPHNPQLPPYPEPFSAYSGRTVLEILGSNRTKQLPPRPAIEPATVDLSDIQGNVLRGFRAREARHVGIHFADPATGRAFVGALASGGTMAVTPADAAQAKKAHCVNLGFTFEGLKALGLSEEGLQKFPQAFREGPIVRAEQLGDIGANSPEHWGLGRPQAGTASGVHAMVSLYVKGEAEMAGWEAALTALLNEFKVQTVFSQGAAKLGDSNRVHFGYRDGIAQPTIAGVHQPQEKGGQPLSPPGDFLLGPDFKNSRGGFYIGELAPELARNATYAAVRVIEQHVATFETLLDSAAERGVDRELFAAKLMGRWRDGSPLVEYPEAPANHASGQSDEKLDAFDYVHPAGNPDDRHGLRCPVGAHIRRLNPRSGLVLGVPWGRRIIRRGLPYGGEEEKGLFGLFFCGDLEAQFEFLLRVWANQDLSAFGLLGTKDPVVGARSESTPFHFHPSEHAERMTIPVPPLTRTAGSLYLLMPGLKGLQWLATLDTTTVPAPGSGHPPAAVLTAGKIDASDRAFQIDPYKTYERLRGSTPVVSVVGAPGRFWVLSHALVEEANQRTTEFLKPGKARDEAPRPFGVTSEFEDGLFFMDPPRHTEVRRLLDPDVQAVVRDVDAYARATADKLLDPLRGASTMDWVDAVASKLPTQVFMEVMGIPESDRVVVDLWTRASLKAHNPASTRQDQFAGATAAMALRTYFSALVRECPVKATAWGAPTLVAALQSHTGCPVSNTKMSPDETMNTSLHFALGGYLSTEFLLATGVYNLLLNPSQWEKLRANRSMMENALWEMLRFDAPFQMADRWVAGDTPLGGMTIQGGSMVTLVYGSANRDPFRDGSQDLTADTFNIERQNAPSNFGFGGGPHNCIGQSLAMAVSKAGIEALLDAFPRASIGEAGSWSSDPYFRTLDRLTLLLN